MLTHRISIEQDYLRFENDILQVLGGSAQADSVLTRADTRLGKVKVVPVKG